MLLLFALSFLAMAGRARRLCQRLHLPRDQWPAGAISLALPTLVLDPFSSALFAIVFPNMAPAAAGLFGGSMLCCCAGALAGTAIGASVRAKIGANASSRPAERVSGEA